MRGSRGRKTRYMTEVNAMFKVRNCQFLKTFNNVRTFNNVPTNTVSHNCQHCLTNKMMAIV